MESVSFYTPKVAIIVPIFNVEKFLTACLESCQKQSYKNIEVIMIDDGSSDSCFDIALDFVRRDSRFVLIKKANGGLSSARNVGLDFLFNELELQEGNSPRTQSWRELDSRCVDERISSISLLESAQPANLARDARIANPTNVFMDFAEYKNVDFIKMQKGFYTYKGAFAGARQRSEAVTLNAKQEVFVFFNVDSKDLIESKSQDSINLESKCEYVHFLDSDDELTLDCIEVCVKTLNEFIESSLENGGGRG